MLISRLTNMRVTARTSPNIVVVQRAARLIKNQHLRFHHQAAADADTLRAD